MSYYMVILLLKFRLMFLKDKLLNFFVGKNEKR